MNNYQLVRLGLPEVIAARQWYLSIERESLARFLGISVKDVRDVMNSPEYAEAVGNLMLSTRSPANVREWIRNEMPLNFAERMGLSERVVHELIEAVLQKLSNDG